MDIGYPTEKLTDARRILMLPHSKGETDSVVLAMHECSLGLRNVQEKDLDGHAVDNLRTLRQLMDTTGLTDSSGRGLWAIKVEKFSEEEKHEFSKAVDSLAHWFEHKLWTSNR